MPRRGVLRTRKISPCVPMMNLLWCHAHTQTSVHHTRPVIHGGDRAASSSSSSPITSTKVMLLYPLVFAISATTYTHTWSEGIGIAECLFDSATSSRKFASALFLVWLTSDGHWAVVVGRGREAVGSASLFRNHHSFAVNHDALLSICPVIQTRRNLTKRPSVRAWRLANYWLDLWVPSSLAAVPKRALRSLQKTTQKSERSATLMEYPCRIAGKMDSQLPFGHLRSDFQINKIFFEPSSFEETEVSDFIE